MFFRKLTAEEEGNFRAWARDNYKAGDMIDGAWHVITQSECVAMNRDNAVFVADDDQEPSR